MLVLAALFCLQTAAKESDGVAGKVRLAVNPIRRVVTMLQSMEKKVSSQHLQEGKGQGFQSA